LQQHAAMPLPEEPPDTEGVDVFALVDQFVALKHEVNLQTKATRAQQQQNAETLQQLGRALDLLKERGTVMEQAQQQQQEEQVRPVLKTFVDLWDALSLALRETQRLYDTLKALPEPKPLPAPPTPLEPPVPLEAVLSSPQAPRSFWSRLLFGGEPPSTPEEAVLAAQRQVLDKASTQLNEQYQLLQQQQAQLQNQYAHLTTLAQQYETARQNEDRLRQMLMSVVTGYTMSLERLERALAQQELEPMSCLGQPFDPETMEVVEVVTQPGRSGTEVIDEVRRGYWRRGRVFRYAQVRVAKP